VFSNGGPTVEVFLVQVQFLMVNGDAVTRPYLSKMVNKNFLHLTVNSDRYAQ
jgi:hypothetical protein